MAIELANESVVAHTKYQGSGAISVPAGQWLHLRHGVPSSATDDLLVQVPAGKAWTVNVVVYIEETTA